MANKEYYKYYGNERSAEEILKDCLGEDRENLIKKCLHVINDIEPYGNILLTAVMRAYENGVNIGIVDYGED